MRLLSTSLFLLAAAAAAVSSSDAAVAKEYPACRPDQPQQYFSALSNEVSQCKKSSTYDLASSTFPSTTQREALCKCSSLLKKMPDIRVPRCKLSLDGNAYKFKDAIESIFADCSGVRVLEEPLPASQAGSGDDAEEEETGADADVTTAPPATDNETSSASAEEDEPSAGSIDELPTTAPEESEAESTTKPPATSAVPTPAPTTSGAAAFTASTLTAAAMATTAAVAVLLA